LSVKDGALHAIGAPRHSGVQIIVTYRGVPGTNARALLADELSNYPSVALDGEPANAILSPMVGDVHGVGGLYQGTVDSPQGPSTVYAVVMAASDGTDSVVLTVLTNLDRDNLGVLFLVDAIQNTFSFQSELTRFGR
jgi:hypothetical protein